MDTSKVAVNAFHYPPLPRDVNRELLLDRFYVSTFLVVRDGSALASVTTTSLDDASVFVNYTYCYQVQGYDPRGSLIASSKVECITVVP